jgi:arginyl-tRNA synthetase
MSKAAEKILISLDKAFKKLNYQSLPQISKTKNQMYGDYSSSSPLSLAKETGQNPIEIAKKIQQKLKFDKDFIENISITNPGFINFKLSKSFYQSIINEVLLNNKFGSNRSNDGKTANVEFVSANPTGPLTIGHGRNGVIGDIISNILEWNGYSVTREYYFNNAGRQMRILGESVKARYLELIGKPVSFPSGGYKGDYIKDVASKILKEKGSKLSDKDDNIFKTTAETLMFNDIKKTLSDLKINFDKYSNEKDYYDNGSIDRMLDEFKQLGYIYDKDGATWFNFSKLGHEQDKVYIKKTGEPTYRVPDTAYHRDKIERGFDLIVDIFGADHKDAYPDVIGALNALGCKTDHINVVIYQFVTLIRDGKKIKMSTRNADFITISELIDQLGSDVVRYFFIMRGVNSHLNFDLNLAEDQSDKNPVFYLQYAHARICSILHRAKDLNKKSLKDFDSNLLNKESELNLLKQISDFPTVINNACTKLEPQSISIYLNEIASDFHKFYNECKVISNDSEKTKSRLALISATKVVLKNGLSILGISAPEKM